MQPLLDRMGNGVFFTVLGCISGTLGCVLVLMVRRYGSLWRGRRECKEMDVGGTKIDEGQVKDSTPSTTVSELC